jgi:putative thiamine transport system ATP-binding protein
METGLTLQNVSIRQDGQTLVSLSAHVAPGQILTVMGPSGSGKSTLLSFITGTLAEDFEATGDILLNGRAVTKLPTDKRKIGILFQDDLLFPHLSVADNLAFGLSPDLRGALPRRERIEEALEEVNLAGFGPRDPATLSGGQRARVSLMRMLLSDPCALLLDEPFSRLDTDRRSQIRSLVFEHARKRQLAVVLVTHDQTDAEAAGGPIFHIGD